MIVDVFLLSLVVIWKVWHLVLSTTVCVCVCVRERERERERDGVWGCTRCKYVYFYKRSYNIQRSKNSNYTVCYAEMHAHIVASQYSSLTRQERPERTHSHSHTETWCNITKMASLWCIFWRVVIVVHFFTSSRISSSAANREWINWEPHKKTETLLFARSEYQLRAVAFNYMW
jgi:ribosomal protein L37AE/L43A